jgi:ribosome assembly protein 1
MKQNAHDRRVSAMKNP